ncbi:DUF4097 family beta strand repeat-containing protein [Bacillus pinisoli]|uniref:DUF4097 family beta strand repeat-containing protein n=1 Tax=Bacillus pinisoli TaxID=2901866 RepID=UPI001FF30196|nr:DUF4097 domain-containing protein [Bacillus pinisoli]
MPIVEERKRILKMIEEGKLSAEEAMALLEQLEKDHKEMEEKQESFVTELSTQVNWNEGESSFQSKAAKAASLKKTVLDFMDKAYKKIKDFDLDFNFGPATSVKHIFQHSDVYLTDVDIDVANGSVRLVPWTERDVRVECEAKVYQTESQDEARKVFLQDVLFSIEGGKLRYSVQKKKMKVNAVMYLPKEHYHAISVRLFNGKIDGEQISVKDFKAKTANGKITLTNFQTEKLEVETANGHITLTKLDTQKIEAETINGTIKVDGSYKKADLQSFNGNIICTVNDARCETLFIKSTTGNIDMMVPKRISMQGEVKTNIGNILCEIRDVLKKEEKQDVVQKYLKFSTLPVEGTDPLLVDVDTKTGSVLIQEKGAL